MRLMKIVNPSTEIIEDQLSQLSIYQRIAYVAGVCYQREPRKTEDEAQAFCRRMVEIGHHSTLEMSVLHLWVDCESLEDQIGSEKYLMISRLPGFGNGAIVSGSIRAFLEADVTGIMVQIHQELSKMYPVFFAHPFPRLFSFIRAAEPHEIPWQHKHVAVRFIVNRAVSHELVRHRPMSFLQESQRYCRYEDEVVFIRPEWYTLDDKKLEIASRNWEEHAVDSEHKYRRMLKCGLKPQQARAVLPNSTKTELITYASLPQWRHMFNLRCSPAADPEMTRVMRPLRDEFKQQYPEMWGDE